MTRLVWAFGALIATSLVAVSTVVHTPTKLIWNASASAPIGLYSVATFDRLKVGDLIAIAPPEPIERFIVDGGYLPAGVPLLKRVLGLPGQSVCRLDRTITVDGVVMGQARERDARNRPLPVWQGCRRIAGDEVFAMNWTVPDSLDGRYFGPIPTHSIIGLAVPVWTDEAGDGRYQWRAGTD